MGYLSESASDVGVLSGETPHPCGYKSHRAPALWRLRLVLVFPSSDTLVSLVGIILTGGRYDDVTTELYIPRPCPGGINHCRLPNVAKEQLYSHTQDGFMACGGAGHQRVCVSLDPATGIWQNSYAWNTPGRFGHVSWSSPDGVSLIGGFGAYVTTGLTTTLLQTMGLALPGFGLSDPSV